MKKLIPILLACLLMLSSCGEKSAYGDIEDIIAATNGIGSYRADFFVEVTFDDETATLLYRNGSFFIDRENAKMYCVESQTVLGTSAKVTSFYDDGCYYVSSLLSNKCVDETADEVFSQLPYMLLPDFDASEVEKFKKLNNGNTLYTFSVKDPKAFLLPITGEDIYSLAMLAVPQKDKTNYGALKCEYTVSDIDGVSCVSSRLYEFDMTVYDTPPYSAGAVADESDYKLDLHFRIRINIKGISEEFEIPEYDKSDFLSE